MLDNNSIQQIEEEKKKDEVEHSVPNNAHEYENKVFEIQNIDEKREKLVKLINSLSSESNFREDLILYLKKWLISDFALRYNFKKILLGTSGHKVATQLLA